MTDDRWPMTDNRWPMAVDRWQRTDDRRGSRVWLPASVIGHLPSVIGHRSSVIGHRSSVICHDSMRSSFPQVVEGIGQGIDDIASDQANLAVLVAGDVAGEAVGVDAEHGGVEGGQALAD